MRRRAFFVFSLIWLLSALAAPAARIVAIGDVHGEIEGFDAILRAEGLIDDEANWAGGDSILVQTGDLMDRGSEVRAVMDRVRALEKQAPAAGGQVHALLGNHEVSNLIHLFDEMSTPAEVYHQIWADFAAAKSPRRQRAAYRAWRDWNQVYPGCVKEENAAWRESREAWLEDHPPGFVEYIEALSPRGDYGRWLRSRSVAVEIDGTLFVHGGISPQLVEQGYRSVEDLNQAVSRSLEQLDEDRQRLINEKVILPFSSLWETACAVFVEMYRLEEIGEPKALLRRAQLAEIDARLPGKPGWFPTDESGPLWYRGLANAEEADLAPQLDDILSTFDARRIAVGHTPQPGEIKSRFDGRVYLMDTAMAYPELGGRAAALEIDGDRVTALYEDERVVLAGGPESQAPAAVEATTPQRTETATDHGPPRLEEGANYHVGAPSATPPAQGGAASAAPSSERVWLGPDGEPLPFESTEDVLNFLARAKVVGSHRIATGVTLPRKLTLELDGVRAHAIFHDVAIVKRRERLRGGKVVSFFRDHYANNIAVFELSRLLGMTNVPPVVERRIGRDKGSVQIWLEGSTTEAERREQGIVPPSPWRLAAKDMQVFDNLINNIDRNQGNILYDADWNLWLIDHTRTLGRTKQLPASTRVRRCSRRLWRALNDLDEAEVRRRLKPYVGGYEIGGLMARQDRLIELIEGLIATNGETAVLFDYDPAAGGGTHPEDTTVPEELRVPEKTTEH